jgi:hypothetical protein
MELKNGAKRSIGVFFVRQCVPWEEDEVIDLTIGGLCRVFLFVVILDMCGTDTDREYQLDTCGWSNYSPTIGQGFLQVRVK